MTEKKETKEQKLRKYKELCFKVTSLNLEIDKLEKELIDLKEIGLIKWVLWENKAIMANKWLEHLKEERKKEKNKGKSLKEVMKEAKKSYKK